MTLVDLLDTAGSRSRTAESLRKQRRRSPWVRNAPRAVERRFDALIDHRDGHWIWLGNCRAGQKTFKIGHRSVPAVIAAFVFEYKVAPATGCRCRRLCAETRCIRPDHYEYKIPQRRRKPSRVLFALGDWALRKAS